MATDECLNVTTSYDLVDPAPHVPQGLGRHWARRRRRPPLFCWLNDLIMARADLPGTCRGRGGRHGEVIQPAKTPAPRPEAHRHVHPHPRCTGGYVSNHGMAVETGLGPGTCQLLVAFSPSWHSELEHL